MGLGCEGEPWPLDIPNELYFEGLLWMLRSCSTVTTAKEEGVDLLSGGLVRKLQDA